MNTPKCLAKRGLFTLFDCQKLSAETCSGCKRSLCREHFPEGMDSCLECTARTTSKVQTEHDPRHYLIDSYRVRHHFLTDDRAGLYLGKELGAYYDEYDLRSFDIELCNIEEICESPDEIFFDS